MRRKDDDKGKIIHMCKEYTYKRQPNVWKRDFWSVLITWDLQAVPEGPQVQLRQAERHLIELKQESVQTGREPVRKRKGRQNNSGDMQQEPCTVSFISPQGPQESCRDTREDCFQSVTSFWHLWSTLKKRSDLSSCTSKKHINIKEMKKDESSTQINICISRVLTDTTCWHTHQTVTPLTHSLFSSNTHTRSCCVSGFEPELCARCQHSVEHLCTSQQGEHTSVSSTHTHTHTHTLWQLPGLLATTHSFFLRQMAFKKNCIPVSYRCTCVAYYSL